MNIERGTTIENWEGRTLLGNAFLFETPGTVTDDGRNFYQEEFARSCANKTISDIGTWALGVMHDVGQRGVRPVGHVTFAPGAGALEFEAKLSNTPAGDEVLTLVKDGALKGVSISARSIRDTRRGAVIRREEIALRELSLTPPGMQQHRGAEVLAIRSQVPTIGHPDLDATRIRLVLLGL